MKIVLDMDQCFKVIGNPEINNIALLSDKFCFRYLFFPENIKEKKVGNGKQYE